MPRKKKAAAPEVVTESSEVAVPPPAVEANEPPAPPPPEPVPAKAWAASGPHWFQAVSLSTDSGGPRIRLGRDNRFQQMAISFDEKPPADVIQQLRDDGWRWRGQEGYWTKQFNPEQCATGQLDAEQLFERLAVIEQRERGLCDVPTVGR